MFAAIRIDGVCYVTEKTETLKNVSFWDKLFPDEINSLNKKYRDGIITAGERTRMREEIIVDGLLKKYTKGLIYYFLVRPVLTRNRVSKNDKTKFKIVF